MAQVHLLSPVTFAIVGLEIYPIIEAVVIMTWDISVRDNLVSWDACNVRLFATRVVMALYKT